MSLKIFYGCWQLVWLLLVLISFLKKWCTLCLKIRVITFYLVFIYCAFNETKKSSSHRKNGILSRCTAANWMVFTFSMRTVLQVALIASRASFLPLWLSYLPRKTFIWMEIECEQRNKRNKKFALVKQRSRSAKVFFSLSLSHFHVARFWMSVTFLMELFEISLKFEFKMFVEAEWVYVPKCWMYWSGSLKHLFEQQQPQQQHKCWHANQREKNHTL